MSAFLQINKLESFIYKVSGAADVLELMASDCSEDPTSGALWYIRDTLKSLVEQAEKDIEDLYPLLQDKVVEVRTKKGKI